MQANKQFKLDRHKPIESAEEARWVEDYLKKHPQTHWWIEWIESRPDIFSKEDIEKEKSKIKDY